MTTEEKLDLLIETVDKFVASLASTVESISAFVEANNTLEETTFDVDGEKTVSNVNYNEKLIHIILSNLIKTHLHLKNMFF